MLLRADQKYDRMWMGWVPAMMKIKVTKLEVILERERFRHLTDEVRDQIEAAEKRLLGVLKRGMLRDGPSEEKTGTTIVDSDDQLTWSDDESAQKGP